MTNRPKRPRDANQLAKFVADVATRALPSDADLTKARLPEAELGRIGRLKGGRARANALSPEQRREIAHLKAQIDDLVMNHTRYDEDQKKVILSMQRKALDEAVAKFGEELDDYSREYYTEPVEEVLRNATKDELVEVAEALVNLTSIKRRISPERETVGGLVDVAVISKGDGFVWIKRKHYFKPELNHHFFENYFRNMGGAK